MSNLENLIGRRRRRNANSRDDDDQSQASAGTLRDDIAPSIAAASVASLLDVDDSHCTPNVTAGGSLQNLMALHSRRRSAASIAGDLEASPPAHVSPVPPSPSPSENGPGTPAPSEQSERATIMDARTARIKHRRRLLREGEPPMSREEALRRANRARQKAGVSAIEATERAGRAAVAQVFTDAVAFSKREALAPDAAARQQVPKGTDGRVWLSSSSLRRVFKELQESGSFGRREGIFGIQPSGTTDLAAVVAVTQAVLDEQQEKLQEATESGGSVIALQWEFDGTPQQIAVLSAAARDKLRGPNTEGTEDVESKDKTGTRDVFVQRARVRILDVNADDEHDVYVRLDEEIFIRPLCLGQQDSGTLRQALLSTFQRVGLDLVRLSQKFELVVLILSQDGCFTNGLVHDWLQSVLPKNIILLKDLCQSHTVNRLVMDHVKKGKFDINSLFSLSRVVHISSYYDLLCSATLAVAFEVKPAWIQMAGPFLP